MLSVVIIAWNEEAVLPRLLASVKGLADEIVVVVDSASVDRTAEIAKKSGCRVFSHPHTGIVEKIRNFAVSKAKGDWILLLDADEEVPAALTQLITSTLASPQADYYRLPRKNIIFGKWIESSHWWPDYVCRLYKKGAVNWPEAIHSLPETKGTGHDFPARENEAIIHHSYSSVSQYIDRLNRYTDFLLATLKDNNYHFQWQDLIVKPSQEFLRQYFDRGGFRDGLHGLALSLLQTFSEAVLYLKAWQSEEFKPRDISASQVYSEISKQIPAHRWWLYQSKINSSSGITRFWWRLVRKIVC